MTLNTITIDLALAETMFDRAFEDREIAQVIGDDALIYNDGLLRAFGWLRGLYASPMQGKSGFTVDRFEEELRIATRMASSEQFDGMEPSYVIAVYRALRWLRSSEQGRKYLGDPIVYR